MIHRAQSHSDSHADDLAGEIRRQQQIFLVGQIPRIAIVNALNGGLTALIFAWHSGYGLALSWYGLLALGSAIQFAGWLRLHNRPVPAKVSGRSLKGSEFWALLMGATWGSSGIIFFSPDSVPHQMFLAVVLAGMTAGTVSILTPLPNVCARFVFAALAPLVFSLILHGSELQLAIAAMAVIFAFTLVNGTETSYRQFAGMVSNAYELERARAHLFNAIESTNDAFAIFDREGKLVLANSRYKNWFPDLDMGSAAEGDGVVRRIQGGLWVQSSLRPVIGGGYVSVNTDVTELKRQQEQLIAAKQQAEEANRAKSEFLANMSHELRTPLNAIIGFSDVMRGEMFGEIKPRYKDYANDIFVSATHLLSLISDILDLSKIESANYRIEPEPVDVAGALAWVVSLCRNQHKMGGCEVQLSVDPALPPLLVDERAFRQVVLNLANNALKFTPETGQVGIEAAIAPSGEPVIRVWDTGIGIPADKLEWVRKPFHQAEGVFHRKYQGTGLGLSISSALVEMHGGHMEIESEEGKGTTVSIYFPRERLLAADAAKPPKKALNA